jgi:hypothetical protein
VVSEAVALFVSLFGGLVPVVLPIVLGGHVVLLILRAFGVVGGLRD